MHIGTDAEWRQPRNPLCMNVVWIDEIDQDPPTLEQEISAARQSGYDQARADILGEGKTSR